MQDKTGKKEEQKNCEREGIFWLSKCSVCGSENISVTFKPEFEYTYYKGNESIGFHCKYKSIEIKCKDCNYCQGTSNSSLIQFISEALNIRDRAEIEKMDDKTFEVCDTNFRLLRIE